MPRRPDVPCAGCSKLVWRGTGSLPPGQQTCLDCRKLGRPATCKSCGQPFMATRSAGGSRRTTCSASCAQGLRNAGLAGARRRRSGGSCACGAPTIGAKILCDPCRTAKRRARWRRINALRRGAISSGPPITIEMLGRRDGWRCHLCGKAVRQGLVVPDPGAPTFDHLIPVSAGGDDRPENLRLAHFRCNSRRGNKGVVQLLLFA